jgi:hypothetical protein
VLNEVEESIRATEKASILWIEVEYQQIKCATIYNYYCECKYS